MIKESGQSEIVGEEFVILTTGREKGWVRYLVVCTWPLSASADERVRDKRFVFGDEGRHVRVRRGVFDARR